MAEPARARGEVDTIARSYLARAGGNPSVALRLAITEALADLAEADRRDASHDRLVSRGYAHCGPPADVTA